MVAHNEAIIPNGFVVMSRDLADHSELRFMNPRVRDLFWWLFRNANRRDNYVCKRGQLVRRYDDIIQSLSWRVGYRQEKYTKHQMKDLMKQLRTAQRITTRKTTRGVVITICDYDKYTDIKSYKLPHKTPVELPHEPPNEAYQPPTTINKNVNKNNNVIVTENVTVTESSGKKIDLVRNYLKNAFMKRFKRLPYPVLRNERMMWDRHREYDNMIDKVLKMVGLDVEIFISDFERVGKDKQIKDLSYFIYRKDGKETRWEQLAEQFKNEQHEVFKQEWAAAVDSDSMFDIFNRAIGAKESPDWMQSEAKRFNELVKKYHFLDVGSQKDDIKRDILSMKKRYGF